MKIELDNQAWQVVLTVLSRAPFSEVAPIINSIMQQAQSQEPSAPARPALRTVPEEAAGA